jgi:hypothetical protein
MAVTTGQSDPVLVLTGETDLTTAGQLSEVQCGTSFTPRREHARFCSPRCRVAWNRHNACDPRPRPAPWTGPSPRCGKPPAAPGGHRLGPGQRVRRDQRGRVVGHHSRRHLDAVSPGHPRPRPAVRAEPDGLRHRPRRLQPAAPALAASRPRPGGQYPNPRSDRSRRAREWEMTRYRAHQAQLAGQPVGATFRRATAFLRLAAEGSSLSRT